MRTQIILLDGYDDVTSACDKIGSNQARRVLLVWPEKGHPLQRKMDLVLLQRRVRSRGIQLALVPRTGEVKAIGREIGLPVFSSIARAERSPWRTSRRNLQAGKPGKSFATLQQERSAQQARPGFFVLPWVRLVVFTVGVFSVLTLTGFMLPGAEVQFAPPSQQQTITWTGEAQPASDGVEHPGSVILRSLDVVVEASDLVQTTGVVRIGDQPSTGMALFTNLTDGPVDIPSGTVIASLPPAAVRFATQEETSIPGGVGKTAQVSIQALVPGIGGNVGKDVLTAIEGSLGTAVSVSNPTATVGGTDRSYPAPGRADRSNLKQRLVGQLQASALSQAQAQLGDKAILVKGSLSTPEFLADQSDPPDQEPADRLEETVRARYTVNFIALADLRAAAGAAMDASLPAGYRAAAVELPAIANPSAAINADGAAGWEVAASRRIERVIPEDAISSLILGKPVAQVPGILVAAFDLPEKPVIRSFPSFWPWVPFLASRIQYIEG